MTALLNKRLTDIKAGSQRAFLEKAKATEGAVLLTAGEKGKRFALPNARIMIHQPWGGAEGKASDIEITAREILRLKEILNQILASHSGKTMEEVVHDTDRDHFMSADEACKWGLIDKVVLPKA